MKNNVKNTLFAGILLSLISCEKIINIDLNSADPKYVIEGIVSDTDEGATVKITQTKNFYEDNIFPGVENAIVKITERGGVTHILQYVDSGLYRAPELKGVSGKTYELSADINGHRFSAESQMPEPNSVDSIYFSRKKYPFSSDTVYAVVLKYTDSADTDDYWRFIMRIDRVKRKQVYTASDEFVNGKPVTARFEYHPHEDDKNSPKLQYGDIMEIEMQCIDKYVYTYFNELTKTIYGSSVGLGNPTSNIKGGALGYFSAHTVWKGAVVAGNTEE